MIEPKPGSGLRVFAALFGARIAAGSTGTVARAARDGEQPDWMRDLADPEDRRELVTVMHGELDEALRARIANPRLRTTRTRRRGACRKRK